MSASPTTPQTHLRLDHLSRSVVARSISSLLILVATLCLPIRAQVIATPSPAPPSTEIPKPLLVVGFLGGRVSRNNLIHRETLLIQDLQQHHPSVVHAMIFANRDEPAALKTILQLLARDHTGQPSSIEKSSARIVLFGHSWGASETIHFAGKLNDLGIPVLLTIQVDSVQKLGENDHIIPPNVREAINFFQTEGTLHGRRLIRPADASRTVILGNFESNYRDHPVDVTSFPWYAKAFMGPHIEIENDPILWNKIEALVLTKATEKR